MHRGDGRVAIIRNGRPFRGVRAGRLLISRHIEHGVFGNSVVLLTEHDHRRGSFGLVINKREFRGVVELDERRDDLRGFFVGRGGPVDTREAVTMLYRAHLGPPPNMAHGPVVGDLPEGVRGCSFVDGDLTGGDMWRDADAAAGELRENGARPHDAIFVTGYAGWGRNQLDGEVAGRVAPRRRGGGRSSIPMIGRTCGRSSRARRRSRPRRGRDNSFLCTSSKKNRFLVSYRR